MGFCGTYRKSGCNVNHSGEFIEHGTDAAGKAIMINPVGYQNVLIFTIALYIVALVLCLVLVKPTDKSKKQ